jgi:hypothetical protein
VNVRTLTTHIGLVRIAVTAPRQYTRLVSYGVLDGESVEKDANLLRRKRGGIEKPTMADLAHRLSRAF